MIGCETAIKSPMAHPRAFDYLSDLANLADWHPAVLVSELVSGGPGLRHSRYRVVTRVGPTELNTPVEVTEVARPSQFAYTATTRLTFSSHEFSFLARESGVEVQARSTLSLTPPFSALAPIFNIYLRAYCRRRADAMRTALGEQLEAGPVWHPGLGRSRRARQIGT